MEKLTPFDRTAGYPSRREYLKQISRLSIKGGSALIAAGMALSSLSAMEYPLPPGDETQKQTLRKTPGESSRNPEKKKPAPTPANPGNPSKLLGTPLPPAQKTDRDESAPKWRGKVVNYPKRDNEKRPDSEKSPQRKPGEAVKPPAPPSQKEDSVMTLGGEIISKPSAPARTSEKTLTTPGESVRPPERTGEGSPKKS